MAHRSALLFLDQYSELGPGKMLEQLIEKTRALYYGRARCAWRLAKLRPRNDSPTFIIGGPFFAHTAVKPVLDKSEGE